MDHATLPNKLRKMRTKLSSPEDVEVLDEAASMLELMDRLLNRDRAQLQELQERHHRAVIALTNPLK